ncbi:MAG: hypothetical protein IKS32_04835 [Solobacterium sp.]|nr:hypothetical protein [Solobacterium sp.]
MLKHEFTLKEKILLMVAVVLALGLVYYNFVYKYFQNQLKLYDTEILEQELIAEQAKASKISQMKQIIDESEGRVTGDLSVYNNQSAEIIEMGEIFDEDGSKVSVTWVDPILTGTIVRRDVNITFSCSSYENFKNILRKMSEMKYRCLIRNVTVAVGGSRDNRLSLTDANELNAAISVTFFETTDGATSLAGLTSVNVDTDLSDSELAKRAHAYD